MKREVVEMENVITLDYPNLNRESCLYINTLLSLP